MVELCETESKSDNEVEYALKIGNSLPFMFSTWLITLPDILQVCNWYFELIYIITICNFHS